MGGQGNGGKRYLTNNKPEQKMAKVQELM